MNIHEYVGNEIPGSCGVSTPRGFPRHSGDEASSLWNSWDTAAAIYFINPKFDSFGTIPEFKHCAAGVSKVDDHAPFASSGERAGAGEQPGVVFRIRGTT